MISDFTNMYQAINCTQSDKGSIRLYALHAANENLPLLLRYSDTLQIKVTLLSWKA